MFLIDGSNHAFRVQFALPPRHTSSGMPTRVLYGFTLLFQKMLRTWKPDYVVVSFDTSGNFRKEIYPDYKGHRPDMPEDLAQQWPLLPDIVEGFGYRAITLDGYEADDVLGTLAKRFASDDLEVFLVTGDKDFTQLVDDNIRVLDESKGAVLDSDGVEEKMGVPPERVIDLLALCGDSSDNIPGVSKVGPKTAVKLLADFGDLEGVLQAARDGKVKGKTGERLVDEADNARLSYVLATIKTDVPMDVSLDDLEPRGLQEERLRELFDAWEFGLVARKLLPEQETVSVTGFEVAEDASAVAAVVADVRAGRLPAFDPAYDDAAAFAPVIEGVAFGDAAGRGVYVPAHAPGFDAVLDLLGDPAVPKLGDGVKRAWRALHRIGRALEGVAGDVRLLDYVLNPHRRTHGLEDQASRHLGHSLGQARAAAPPEAAGAADATERAQVIAVLHKRLADKLEGGLRFIFERVELPLVPVLARMEALGIRVDRERLATVEGDVALRLDQAEAEIHELAGKVFNVRSRHELRDVLFDELKLTPGKKVKDGYSTASDVLEKIVGEHPIVQRVLDYRELDKLLGTYISKLPSYVAADGRIHTTFRQTVAATGRLSSADPNLQNIPVRTEEGRRIRAAFVPAPGCVFLSADYSQIELRVLAHYTGDPVLTAGFRAGEDIHRRTAVELFGVDPAGVTVAQRSAAKAINFGLIYGMSAFRLGNDLQIPQEEARAYMEAYFARMPAVRDWIEATKAAAHEQGQVETLYGRRRVIPELHSRVFTERSAGEREAVNTRIQGTAADLIKLAMLAVDKALAGSGLGARVLLQVHDELLLEVPENEVEPTAALVREAMQSAAQLDVPLVVNTATGRDWEEAHG